MLQVNASTVTPMAVASSNERMIAGVAAAAVSLGVAQLVGIPFGARADARAAIGSVVVDLTPGPIKEWAIQTLGSLDKLFLAVVVLVVIATIAAIAGSFETRRRPIGSAVIAAAGVLGCIAVLSRQGATALDTIPTVAGAACGVAALRLLTRRFWPDPKDPADGADHDEPDAGRRTAGHVRIARIRSSERRGGCGHHAVGAFGGRRPQRRHTSPTARTGAADTRRCAAERRCATELYHRQRRLLPGGHRTQRSPTQPRRLAAAHPRHGGPRSHLQLRRPRPLRRRRNGDDVDLCVESRWRKADFDGRLDRLPGGRSAGGGRRARGRRHGALDVDRRIHRRHAGGGAHRWPRRASGGRASTVSRCRSSMATRPGWWYPGSTGTCRPPSGSSTWS